ncbi:unnamed protein product [Caenorhabditis bovis]|uniref:Uncharacterized protein n=1 Tax=Caenorhabditis bovis TaxID=2654633 RepID=A0A8S1EKU4_9PELO|nr:unnamed protein product [Caenorhabditis bovis]
MESVDIFATQTRDHHESTTNLADAIKCAIDDDDAMPMYWDRWRPPTLNMTRDETWRLSSGASYSTYTDNWSRQWTSESSSSSWRPTTSTPPHTSSSFYQQYAPRRADPTPAQSVERPTKRKSSCYFDKWKLASSRESQKCSDDDVDDFVANPCRRKRPKQIRIDDYLFKARRVDKGARVFGLKTIQEPKRGSKKKRKSIGELEVVDSSADLDKSIGGDELGELEPNEMPSASAASSSSAISLHHRRVLYEKCSQASDVDLRNAKVDDNNVEELDETIRLETPKKFENCRFQELNETIAPTTPTNGKSPNSENLDETVRLATPKRQKIENIEIFAEKLPSSTPKYERNVKIETFTKKGPTFDDKLEQIKKFEPANRILEEEKAKRDEREMKLVERRAALRAMIDTQFIVEREKVAKRELDEARARLADGEVIRSKADRRRLMHGADCRCCRGYYDQLGLSPNAKKDYMDRVSRHRYVHRALPDTPERYWDLTLGPSDEEQQQQHQKVDEKPAWRTPPKRAATLGNWETR